MRKLYRSTLVAVVLAFGVVACGDDVQIVEPEPTPPPALQVTLTPQNVNLVVGDNVNLAVGISGGQEGAAVTITCESSNPSVVSTSVSGNNCAVTAEGPGNATVTATVQKGNQESSAGAAVSVQAVDDIQEATVTIADIMQGGTTADINNVSGQLDVRMNVNFGDEQPVRLNLYVDDDVVATQEFSQAVAAVEEGDDPAEQVQQITLSFNTDYYTIEDGVALIRSLNGDRVISAELTVATEDAEPRASNTVTVRFNNRDGFHVEAMLPDNSAMDGEGRRWFGGWGEDEGAEVTAIPVFFSGQSAANVFVSLCPGETLSGDEAPFDFTFACANFESERRITVDNNLVNNPGEAPSITATYAETGNDVPTVGGVVPILNTDHPFPARIDNVAPGWVPGTFANSDAIDGVLFIGTQDGLWNRENWINDDYMFSTGLQAADLDYDADFVPAQTSCDLDHEDCDDLLLDAEITDGGSSWERDLGIQWIVTTADGDTMQVSAPEDLDESNLNTDYRLHVELADALGNTRLISQSRNPYAIGEDVDSATEMTLAFMISSHYLNTFGVDRTPPQFAVQDVETALDFADDYIVDFFGDYHVAIEYTDEVSGFINPDAVQLPYGEMALMLADPTDEDIETFDAALTHLLARVTGTPGSTELNRTRLVGGDPDTFVDNPFETSEADEFIGGAIPTDDYTHAETKLEFELPLGFETPGYYFYQVRAQDKAGNRTEVESLRSYLNAASHPEITGLNPGGFFRGGDEVAFAATATDPVEVLSASFALTYPDVGNLLFDRSPEAISVLFTDEITRPVDFQFVTAPGFIRSLAMVDEDGSPTDDLSKPNRIEARAYSGYTWENDAFVHLDDPDQVANHFSEFGPNQGFSDLDDAAILGDQVEDGVPFQQFDAEDNPSGIVSWTLTEDNGSWVARARGVSGQFPNPFAAVVLVARVDSDNGEYLIPLDESPSTSQFDSGQIRDYLFTFAGDFEAPEGSEFMHFHAVGISAAWDGLATRPPEPEPEPEEFNVQFEQAAYDVLIGGPAVNMVVEHGPFSTDDAIVVTSCDFVDADEEPVPFDPTDITLAVNGDQDGCVIDAGEDAVEASHTVMATVEHPDNGDVTTTTTVNIIEPEFSISIDGPATIELAETPTNTEYSVVMDFGEGINDLVCQLSEEIDGVSVAPDGVTACVVRVAAYDDAQPAEFDVIAIAQETGTDAEATDSQSVSVVMPDFDIEIDGASTITVPTEEVTEEYTVTAVALTGPIASLTCSIEPGTTGVSVAADGLDTCVVTVTSEAEADDQFNVIADAVEEETGAEASALIIVTLEAAS